MKYLILFVILIFNISAGKQDLPGELKLLLKEKKPTYVIANAALPYSYDPLEDLNLNNSRIIRMIHARIVESDANGRFSSRVLKSYNYDEAKKTLFFEIKNNVRYTDGSLLTPNDVALAIKRNALLRPNLPGVSKIMGLDNWLKNTHPLLSKFEGVRVEGNKVLVRFNTNLESPIDKFNACFGVIPEKSVDLKTGHLKEVGLSIPPSAGHYKIVPSKLSNGKAITEPTFVKLERVTDDKSKPEVVWIVYMSPTNIGKYMKDYHDDVVICAHEIDIEPYMLKTLKQHFTVHTAPKIMYSFLLLNPTSAAFKEQRVRQYFAIKYREKLAERGYPVEGSQPTKEMLGYLSLRQLNNLVEPFSKDEEIRILEHLRSNPPVWMKSYNIVTEPFADIFNAVCNDLRIPLKEVKISKFSDEYKELWEQGVLGIRLAYSTLGPADPTGDIKTVFSGIHSFLRFVTDDPKLKDLVKKVEYYDEGSHVRLNRYLFTDSKFAVVSNYSRLYLSTGKISVKSSFRRQEPVVWEFFQK